MMTRTFYRQYSVFKVQTSYEASLCQRAFGDLIIIRNRINMLIRMQYKILMLLPYDQAKVELRGFDDKLRSKSEVLYGTCLDNDSKRRFIGSRILKILRKDDFRHFRLLNTVWRKKV